MKNKILLLLGVFLTLSLPLYADNGWTVNPYDYRYDMSAYVKLEIDGAMATDLADYDVAAFCGDECRGILDVRTAAGSQYGYVRIRSNSADGEVIGFKIIDKVSGKDLKCETTLDFVSDSSVGLPSSPFVVAGANLYDIVFMVDDEAIVTQQYYGDPLEATDPVKEGHEFTGWDPELPEIVPAEDLTFTATFKVLSYTVSYILEDQVYEQSVVEYGTALVPPEAPEKEGYTFSGWKDLPATMPAGDIEILGGYTVNQYKLIYNVDGEVYKEFTVDYGTAVVAEPGPEKEGFTFSGWDGVPETMPAHDVTVAGTFSINSYEAVFKIDGEIFDTKVIEFGRNIETPEAPKKSGFTFSGWQDVPATMPARDIEIIGWYVSNVEITFSRKQIHLNCTQYENASIRYTTDGSNPTASSGEVYSSPFLPENDCTIKAVAYKDGSITTDVASYIYIAEDHTVPNLNIVPVYSDRIVVMIPETDDEIIASSDSIMVRDQVVLKGGDKVRQLEFPTDIFDNVAVFEWKSAELLERGPVVMPIEYAQTPQIDYDGVSVRMSNDIGHILLYGMRYDDGNVFENEESIPDGYLSFNPEMTGLLECFAYDDGLFRSDAAQLEIHAIRFEEDRTVMLNENGFLGQAIREGDALDWESLTIIGPTESNVAIDSKDLSIIATLNDLHHIDLTATAPLQDSQADFSRLSRLMSLSMPKSNFYVCDWNLDKISLLSAIKWNMSEPMSADMFATIANRHALVYVDDLSLAPENAINIVCDGYAPNLTLTHDYPFCVIDEFIAGEAVFTKNFSRPTYIGQCRGWETMWIPFDVDQVIQMDDRQREILPFLAIDPDDMTTPGFWLSSPDSEVGDWVDHDSIKGCVPYVIAMPNNPDYVEEFNIRGNVAFVGHNVKVSDIILESGMTDEDGNYRTFYGSCIPMSSSDHVFSLTEELEEGEENMIRSVFSPDGDEVRPFECWFDGAPGMKKISFGGKTDSVAQLSDSKEGVRIWQEGGNIFISSSICMPAAVTDMAGSIVRRISLKAGETKILSGLTPGVYIIANRKILVK
ncbi:MAG: InlB B-repeat-containing protein [Muribaculaceae bacterium]|nr:InlB B-repeat-containing protein [Muribaculaceae bacterium]